MHVFERTRQWQKEYGSETYGEKQTRPDPQNLAEPWAAARAQNEFN